MDAFAAVDVETANEAPGSICAIGVVVVRAGKITERFERQVRPPSRRFTLSYVHGLTWETVADAPPFHEVWPEVLRLMQDARFIAAHRAKFDEWALSACCQRSSLPMPAVPFHCTARLAQRTWGYGQLSLAALCQRLGIPHRPHEALSDAEAAARVVLAARAHLRGDGA